MGNANFRTMANPPVMDTRFEPHTPFRATVEGPFPLQQAREQVAAATPPPAIDGVQDFSAIDDEIAQLEAELAGLPSVGTGQQYAAPQAPQLPGAEMFQNPLLRAIQDDVTRRVFANQASRRRTGAGETAVALQNALAPTALNLGLTQQARQQTQQQQNVDNLFRLFGMGANVAAGQGQAGMQGASNIGNALQAGGLAQAQGALGRGQAIQQGLGNLAGFGGLLSGGGSLAPTQSFAPTVSTPFLSQGI